MLTEQRRQVRIDLDQFKLHLNFEPKIHLSLHFDTPSRKFYLSVIALVVNEMSKNQGVKSISLKTHHDMLAMLNETVGGFAGSSEKEKLIPRIYKKWKSDLPDLENAPLFRIVGRKKEYDMGVEKAYTCSEDEKDSWANLFDYKGSGENVRLRFSIDTLGADLHNCALSFKGYENEKAWDQFVAELKKDRIAKILPASLDKMAYPLPEKPSIAILPFDNFSGDPEQDYIADGFTENIITGLSQIPELFVIARNSAFTYKGRPVTAKQVSEELGVKYILEGSIQKAGDQLRVSAQLIDALKGHHLWSKRYDRELKDLFKLQDEITLSVLNALHVKLLGGGEGETDWLRTESFEAWGHFVKGIGYLNSFTPEGNSKGKEHLEKAIELDSEYWAAWYMLAHTHLQDIWLGTTDSPIDSLTKVIEIEKKTSGNWPAANRHALKSSTYARQHQYEKAIVEGEKAVVLSPNNASYLIALAGALNDGARPEEAIVYAKKAMRLEPYYPKYFLWILLWFYDQAGRYEEELELAERLLEHAFKGEWSFDYAYTNLAVSYARLNRMEEARACMKELLKIGPGHTLKGFKRFLYRNLKDKVYADSIVEMLRRAGMPE